MENILVLTDFSDIARHAIDYACNLANEMGTEKLYILNSFEIIPLYDSGEAGSLALTMQQASEMEEARVEAFKKLKEELAPRVRAKVVPLVVNGSLTDAVNDVCEEKNINLVVMGVKAKDEIEEVFFGSHVFKAIEKIEQPVLIVPKNAAIQLPKKVVLAADFNKLKDGRTLKKLKHFLERFRADITGVHKKLKGEDGEVTAQLSQNLKSYLADHHCELVSIDENADLTKGINECAREENASLIVTIHKTRGFFSSMFHKSVSKNIAWHSDIPVLVLHVKA